MHPWKKLIGGNTQVEEASTCFMCLKRVTNIKFENHMTKVHAATCSKDRLDEMCRVAEEKLATELLNFDDIIEVEKDTQETLKKRMAFRIWAKVVQLFRRKQELEQGNHNTISLKCFLCQGNWNGNDEEELREHLEKDHKVIFQIKELIKLSKPEGLEPAATTDEEEGLMAITKTRVDTNSGIRQLINIL